MNIKAGFFIYRVMPKHRGKHLGEKSNEATQTIEIERLSKTAHASYSALCKAYERFGKTYPIETLRKVIVPKELPKGLEIYNQNDIFLGNVMEDGDLNYFAIERPPRTLENAPKTQTIEYFFMPDFKAEKPYILTIPEGPLSFSGLENQEIYGPDKEYFGKVVEIDLKNRFIIWIETRERKKIPSSLIYFKFQDPKIQKKYDTTAGPIPRKVRLIQPSTEKERQDWVDNHEPIFKYWKAKSNFIDGCCGRNEGLKINELIFK